MNQFKIDFLGGRAARDLAAGTAAIALIALTSACGATASPSGEPSTVTATETVTTTETATATTTPDTTNSPSRSNTTNAYLNEMVPLTSTQGVDTSTAEVNGHGYPRSVTLTASAGGPVNEVEYNIGRRWNRFKATIGLRDDSPTGSNLTFEVSIDEKRIYKKLSPVGEDRVIDLNVKGALRLKLTVTYAGQDSNYIYGTWGDAQLNAGS
ncbi:NPCBM/NEW2 domain-containing protein [Streptomyces sp. NPDC006668]|uniref:NPCBM/NEW2 domain-containing protein n=1 Tax=Streptomyces sp. NPDC006668 TaxID=3156903 RepID=UPI0033D16CEC